MWETKALAERSAIVKDVMKDLMIEADVAKLGAMLVKGYIAKSKRSYLECANCYLRIHRETDFYCEGTQNLINCLKDKTFIDEIYSITDIK